MVSIASLLSLLLLSSIHADLPPFCEWLGHGVYCGYHNCPAGYRELTRLKLGSGDFGANCWTGEKTMCCKDDVVSSDHKERCAWYGTAPWCLGECPAGKVELARGMKWAQKEISDCRLWGTKKFCCDPEVILRGRSQ